jgi:hypothetical protein|tara:strand:- start:8176 stop:8691 length:516 start_codon:yes stop_codon:yes gene_type:complete
MVNVIFIDDNYLYQNFPLPKRMERAALLSIVQLEQYTTLQDLLGTCLYEHMETGVLDQTLNTEEQELFKLMKYILAMYSAKASITMLRTQTANTKREESVQDQYVLDTLVTNIDGKLGYIAKRISQYVEGVATLKAIATATDCGGDLWNKQEVYNSSVYYPSTGIVDPTCE